MVNILHVVYQQWDEEEATQGIKRGGGVKRGEKAELQSRLLHTNGDNFFCYCSETDSKANHIVPAVASL